ncbi:hypothetical protein S40285_03864 [Stachybotrys chlorohalonatus IBT 40285]|uniref:Uncharacterized protein n=1 Tax=Stachybotrys chlorohalonatus (strain IBT 40285) TaxID=1283841 RepID=A0A084QLW0_STAC4|nr:hypothetical protein S40285_03864 [Stachybotrys chlorohalonata IBT 40285]
MTQTSSTKNSRAPRANHHAQRYAETRSLAKRKHETPVEGSDNVVQPTQPRASVRLGDPKETPSNVIITYAKISARTQARIDRFNSRVFDKLIYGQQGALAPPPGVAVSTPSMEEPPKPVNSSSGTSTRMDKRLYLPVNPAIHRPYQRTQVWQDKKDREIQARKGRKYWFGKVTERQRWLQSKEKVDGKGPLEHGDRTDPPPRSHDRPLDFADVPESELPSYVRDNPAWLMACRWQREQRLKGPGETVEASNKSKKRKGPPNTPS